MVRAKTSLMEEEMIKILKLVEKNRKALKLESTQTFGREAGKHVAEKKANTLKQDITRKTFGRGPRKLKPEKNKKVLELDFTPTLGKGARKKVNMWKQDIIRQTFGREVRKLKPERNKKVMKLDFTPTLGKWARKHTTEDTRKVLKVDFSQILKRKQFGQFGDQDPSWSREQNDMGGSWVRENWP